MSSASEVEAEELGHFVGLGVVLDNPPLYDYTALQPIIIHYFASPTFIFTGKLIYIQRVTTTNFSKKKKTVTTNLIRFQKNKNDY